MKRRFHRESHVRKSGTIRCGVLVCLAGLLVAGCSSPPPFYKYSRLADPEKYAQRQEEQVDNFMSIQPPSYDTLVRRQWNVDKVRYKDWLEEELRRAKAREDRVLKIVERQDRFFREYLRMSRFREASQK